MTSSATIRKADGVVRRNAPELNASARQIALAIGLLETGFGVDGSWVFEDGTPSYNWGGLVGAGTAGSLVHGDHEPDGTPVEYKFKAFYNMDEAFQAFRATWTRGDIKGIGHPEVAHEPNVLAAAARGDARAVATTMYAHGYYGGIGGTAEDRIEAYAKAIEGASRTVAAANGEVLAVKLTTKPGASATITSRLKDGAKRLGHLLTAPVQSVKSAVDMRPGVVVSLADYRHRIAERAKSLADKLRGQGR